MQSTLAQLCEIRSQQSEALLSYLRGLEQDLARNPLLERFGRKLDDLRVPLRVVPHEPIRDMEEVRSREHFREMGSYEEARGHTENGRDGGPRRLYAFRGTGGAGDTMERTRPEPLDEVAPKLQTAVLLGDPGSGKTEWLKLQARQAARESRTKLETFVVGVDEVCISFYVRLREVAASLGSAEALREFLVQIGCVASRRLPLNDAERAAAALVKTLLEHYVLPPRLAPLVWQRLLPAQSAIRKPRSTVSRALLCLDAWDEVRAPDDRLSELARCLNALAQITPCRVFLSSRIIGYSHGPFPVENKAGGPRRELRFCPFEWGETLQFAQFFFRDDPERGRKMLTELRAKPNVAGMSQNPLLAALLCMAFAPNPNQPPLGFPARRVEVYERVLGGLLGEWEAVDKGVTPDRELIHAKLRLLEDLANRFYPDEELSAEQLHEFLWNQETGYLSKLDATHPLKRRLLLVPDSSLMGDLCRDGVLVPLAGGGWMFLHLTFQEYFSATALARQAKDAGWHAISDVVIRKSWQPAWEEVLVMLAGKLDDPETSQAMLAVLSIPPDKVSNPSRNDVFYHRLALAVRCLPEIAEPIRFEIQEVVSEIAARTVDAWWKPHLGYRFRNRVLARALPALGLVNPEIPIQRQRRARPAPLLDQLAWLLANPNADLRLTAAWVVREIGPAAGTQKMLNRLAGLLANPKADLRLTAAFVARDLGAAAGAEKIFDWLAQLLANPERAVRLTATWVVCEIGAAAGTEAILDQLAQLLASPERDVCRAAVGAVGRIGAAAGTEKILDQLVGMLANPNEGVRRLAAEAVGRIGGAAGTEKVLDQLVRLLDNPNADLRRTAAWVVREIGAAAGTEKILDQLAGLLANPNADLRRAAALAVGGIGVAAGTDKISDQLAGLLANPNADLRLTAAWVVREIGAAAGTEKIVDRLAQLLASPDRNVRRAALWAVRDIGAAAGTEEILDRLAQLLASPDRNVHRAALRAVQGIGAAAGTEGILDQLAQLLASPDGDVRWAAAWAVRAIGAPAGTEEILDQLGGMLANPNADLRLAAAQAIGGIGVAAGTHKIVDQLGGMLANPNSDLRRAAAWMARDIGAAAGTEKILDQLAGLLADPRSDLRLAAAQAIVCVGVAAGSEKVLDQVARLLASPDRNVRRAAVQVVGDIGAAAGTEKVLDRLARLLADHDGSMRLDTAEAVKAIGPGAGTEKFLNSLLKLLTSKKPRTGEDISALLLDLCGNTWRVFKGARGYLLCSMAQLTADGGVEPVSLNQPVPPPRA